jgi:DNA-directed RNA polymerase subunit RPC12/RpoP
VRLALRNFRNRAGFHECPRCKSRSVWKADPQGALEETLHLLLIVSPYRCARCDKRFMDSKVGSGTATETASPRISRWLASARSILSRVLTRRAPFEDGLRLNSIFARKLETTEAPLPDTLGRLTKAS